MVVQYSPVNSWSQGLQGKPTEIFGGNETSISVEEDMLFYHALVVPIGVVTSKLNLSTNPLSSIISR